MFKFLKEKLKQGISLFSKKIDEKGEEETKEQIEIQKKEEKAPKKEEKQVKKQEKSIIEEKKNIHKDEKEKKSDKKIEELEQKPAKKSKEEPKQKEQIKKEPKEKQEPKRFEKIKQEEKKSEPNIGIKKQEEKKETAHLESQKDKLIVKEEEPISKEPVASQLSSESEKQKKPGFFSRLFKKEKKPEEKIIQPQVVETKKEGPIIEFEEEKYAEEEKPIEIQESFSEVGSQQEIKSEESITVEEKSSEIDEEQKAEDHIEEATEETKEEQRFEQASEDEKPEKKGFFSKITHAITTKKINDEKFDEMFWDLEVILLENNVALEVIQKIKEDMKKDIVDKPLQRSKIENIITESLKDSIEDVLSLEKIDIFAKMKHKKPFVICFVGINGSGKTTTIAKVTKLLLNNNKKVVLAAADTFRAAAIEQLQTHADALGVKMIRHDYGSDPAAVAFDAIKYAESKGVDAVLIDTAGRLHSNTNLVDEMKKIIRVTKPDLKIFVGEAITGNDCIEQAVKFNEAIGIDGIILSKADIDEKGGASISVSYVTKKPIIFIGTGQEYNDLKPFEKNEILETLGLAS